MLVIVLLRFTAYARFYIIIMFPADNFISVKSWKPNNISMMGINTQFERTRMNRKSLYRKKYVYIPYYMILCVLRKSVIHDGTFSEVVRPPSKTDKGLPTDIYYFSGHILFLF